MQQAGVIVLVEQATPWINSFLIMESINKADKKKLHICLDPSDLNKAVIWELYYYCTPDDIYHQLAKATCFTVVDLKNGY